MRLNALIIASLLLATSAAHAEIYTWVDAQGVRHYSDDAASSKAKPADLPGLQGADGDPDALERLKAMSSANAANDGQPPDSRVPRITQPSPEATLRSAQGVVPVALTIGGGNDLRDGEQITYYLDGSPIPQSPTDRTRLKLGNVPRGSHTLSAALLYQGRELRRTQPLTFYMRPPTAVSPLNNPAADSDGVPGAATAPPAGNVGGAPATPRVNTSIGASS